MNLAFAGTPEFARVALAALHAAGHRITLVLTQPDRPAGRGLKLQASPVKQFAIAHQLPMAQPRGLKLDGRFADDARAAQAALQAPAPEVMVVAAYGLILPAWTLALPRRGCFNIHASLLPRWRGAAPIQRAIEAGDAMSGITIMRMDVGLDTGPMLLSEPVPIAPADSAAALHECLAVLGAELIVRTLAGLEGLPERAQPEHGVSYAHKIDKAEAAIDWRRPAAEIERRIRAFDPAPGCHGSVEGVVLKVWRARVASDLAAAEDGAAPGERLHTEPGRLVLACGDGSLELLQVQPPGGRRMTAREWLARVA